MNFANAQARIFVPDGTPAPAALRRLTHLGIGAHQDDLEIMAWHGILECYGRDDAWFGGVTCTDGGGSSRSGPYARLSDEEMKRVRVAEQDAAAVLGNYGAMIQLAHPSAVVKDPASPALREDLIQVLGATRPVAVYTHNPADKHDTHIGVLVAVVDAIRALPPERRPVRLLGCEVWRGLDWMADEAKVALDVSNREHLFQALVGAFDSQIAGGKRYDLATLGRARANATYFQSHHSDAASLLWFAMDLTPLLRDESLDLVAFVDAHLAAFATDVRARLGRRLGR